jgi:hypothetical protein
MKFLLTLAMLVGAFSATNAQDRGGNVDCNWSGAYSNNSYKCVCVVVREARLDKALHTRIIGIPFVCKGGQWSIQPVPRTENDKCVDIEYSSLEAAEDALNSPVIAAICRQH